MASARVAKGTVGRWAAAAGVAVLTFVGFLLTAPPSSAAVALAVEPSATCIVQGGGIDFVVRAVNADGSTDRTVSGPVSVAPSPSTGVSGPGVEHAASLVNGEHVFDPGHDAANFGSAPFAATFANTGTYTLTATSGSLTGSVQIRVVTDLSQCGSTPTTTTTTTSSTTTTTVPTTTTSSTTTTVPTTTTSSTTTTTVPTTTTSSTTTTTVPTTTTSSTTTTTVPTTTTSSTTTTTVPTTTTSSTTTTTVPTTTTTAVAAECRPGYGYGDENQCHSGPPGHTGDRPGRGGGHGPNVEGRPIASEWARPWMTVVALVLVLLVGLAAPGSRRFRQAGRSNR